jgi:hypothetical protein
VRRLTRAGFSETGVHEASSMPCVVCLMDQQTWIMALWIIERHGLEAPKVAEEIVERLRREHADHSQIIPWLAIHDAAVEWLRRNVRASDVVH